MVKKLQKLILGTGCVVGGITFLLSSAISLANCFEMGSLANRLDVMQEIKKSNPKMVVDASSYQETYGTLTDRSRYCLTSSIH